MSQLESLQLLTGNLSDQVKELRDYFANTTGQRNASNDLGRLFCGRDRTIFNVGPADQETLQKQEQQQNQGRLESRSSKDQLDGVCECGGGSRECCLLSLVLSARSF